MKNIRGLTLSMATVLFLLASPSANAQTTNAQIVGDVTDPSGAAIPGTTVTVRNMATGVSREVTTNEMGQYRVYPLLPGDYEVTASATGFKTQVHPNVALEVAAVLQVNFTMELGEVSETVEVTGAAPILQTQEASVGGTVSETEIESIPVNGRNYTNLILIMPGTSGLTYSQSRGTQSGTRLISVNGARPQDNNFSLDGVDNNMMMMNSPGSSPPMDAIQEFRVATNNNAEFGRSAGANVNIAIKSGTRDLHGTAYEYLRNDKFDANDWFANRAGSGKTAFRQNQYGVAIGGPVVIPKVYNGRENTFWFFNWEGYRRRRGNTALASYPTPLQRQGDFSEVGRPIFNPFTGRAITDGPDAGNIRRDPFPGNAIPKSLQHHSILTYWDTMIPLPNLSGLSQNYINTRSTANDRDSFVVRGDHRQGDKDTFSVRYLHQNVGQLSPGSNPNIVSNSRYDGRNLMAQWNHIFGATSVLEVRFGYNRPMNPGCSVNSATSRGAFLDATGIQMFQRDVFCDPIPNLNSEGEFSAGGGGSDTGDKIYQFVTNFSQTVGRHTIKFGWNYARRNFLTNTSNPMNGNAWFNQELTSSFDIADSGFSTATQLLGLPRRIRRATGETKTDAIINAHQFFVQDDWRVNSKLTINLGLRYEYNNAPYDRTDQLGNLWVTRDPDTGKYTGNLMWATVNPEVDPVTGERNQPARTFGFGRALMQSDKNNFAPRLGIAYRINDKTVIRSGFGVFYNTTFVQELQDLRKFWPYTPQQVFDPNNVTAADPVPKFFIDSPGPDFSSTAAIGGWPQNPENRSPYSMQWNFTIQRELLNDLSLDVAYVGSSSRKQVGYTAINAPLTPGPGKIQPRRLLPNFGNIDGGANRFGGKYNAFQVSLNKRFSSGLGFRLNYTWSKAMDEQSSLAEWKSQDPFNIRNDWSRSSWDLKHVFQITYQWDLPFGRGRRYGSGWGAGADAVLGGWSVEGFTRYNTGPPFNVVSGVDRANVGRTYQRPDVTCDPNNGPKTAEEWYASSCFQLPELYTYGNAGAYMTEADGLGNWDISIAKQWTIKENHLVIFRTELFNTFNNVNFRKPGGRISENWSSSQRGRVGSTTTSPRQIQFALRYQF